MSEEKKALPLLMDNLTTAEKVLLANLSLHPGYKVLIKLLEAACTAATNDVIKLDPMVEEYRRKLEHLQQAARTVNKFSSLVLRSVDYHSQCGQLEASVAETDVEKLVNDAQASM